MASISHPQPVLRRQSTLRKFTFVLEPRLIVPLLLIAAAVLLGMSMDKPFWEMHLDAPQYDYCKGLNISVYVDDMKGIPTEECSYLDPLHELNGLNHYIGMRPLDDAAKFERSIAIPSIITFMVLLTLTAVIYLWKNGWKYSWLLTLPALGFPVVFLADLYYWLRDSGMNLDPTAALSSTIKPFIPIMLGEGKVGQFYTIASLGEGFYFAAAASVCILVALVYTLGNSYLTRRAEAA